MVRNKRRWLLPAVILGLMLCACAGRKLEPDVVIEHSAPDWIQFTPEDIDAFHGIGFVPLSLDPIATRRAAVEKAKANLFGFVQTQLRQDLVTSRRYVDLWSRVAWDDFDESIGAIRVEDTYLEQHKNRLWAHVALDQDKLTQYLNQRISSLGQEARRHREKAIRAEKDHQWTLALREWLSTLSCVSGPEGLRIKREGGKDLLRLEAENALSELIKRFSVQRLSGPESSRGGGLKDTYLMLRVKNRNNGTPVSGMPIQFKFISGDGQLGTPLPSGSDGGVRIELQALDPRVSPVQVNATIDLNAMLRENELPPLPEVATRFLELPVAEFPITLEPLRLLLMHIERGGSGDYHDEQIFESLTDAIRDYGIKVQSAKVDLLVHPEVFRRLERGENPGEVKGSDLVAVVVVSLDRIRKQQGEKGEVSFGSGEAFFRLFDLSQQRLLVDERLEKEAAGFSEGDVERNFFRQATDELRDKVVTALEKQPFLTGNR